MAIMYSGKARQAKRANLEDLKKVHAALGWRLLMNEHVVLEKGGEQIALIGIENWGAKAQISKIWENGPGLSRCRKISFQNIDES